MITFVEILSIGRYTMAVQIDYYIISFIEKEYP